MNQAETEKAPLLLPNLSNYLLFNKHQEKLHQKFQKYIKYTPWHINSTSISIHVTQENHNRFAFSDYVKY